MAGWVDIFKSQSLGHTLLFDPTRLREKTSLKYYRVDQDSHRPQYSADWGDYISFTHHLHNRANDQGVDLLLVDSGDRVEGNGLYDASVPKGRYHYDLFVEQELDILCVGNHELYHASTVSWEKNSTVRDYRKSYVASNVDYIDPSTGERRPLARRYRRFQTKNQKLDVIAFGFLFDFTGNANNSFVQPAAETVQEKWFQDAVREKPDVFIVVGHIALRMPELRTIFRAIRELNWHAPIILFGGHAHVRDAVRFDSQSLALASGRFFETIGWVSMDGFGKGFYDPPSQKTLPSFTRRYLDNNLYGMYHHTGLNRTTFPTQVGERMSGLIAKARKDLDLDRQYGCAPQNFWVNRAPFPGNESIYTWLQDQVLPDIIDNKQRGNKPRLAIINTGGIRFDIFRGPFTRDSAYIVSPFRNGLSYVPDVPFRIARRVIDHLNSGASVPDNTVLAARLPSATDSIGLLPGATSQFELRKFRREAHSSLYYTKELSVGYTTSDDLGTDGDDTVHEPFKGYDVPNCIQAKIAFEPSGVGKISEPETVDLVFLDFLKPWIIPALQFSGGDYSDNNVSSYAERSFTDLLVDWISNHWAGNCENSG